MMLLETENIEAVKQRLAAGTDVNSISEIGTTPLHHVTHFLDEIDIDTAKTSSQ